MPHASDAAAEHEHHEHEEHRTAPPYFAVLVVAGLIVIGAGMQSLASVVAPLFLVITLVITVAPLRNILVKRGVPNVLAGAVVLVVIYALLGLILGSVVFAVVQLVNQIPQYADALTQVVDSAAGLLGRFGLSTQELRDMAAGITPTSLAGPAQALLSGLSGGVTLLLFILAVTLFLSFESGIMPRRLAAIRRTRPQIADGMGEFANRVRRYWVVTTVFGLIVAVLDVIALMIIGVPLYLTWGVLAFVTNYIPNIGFVIGVIPPALIALLDGGPGTALAVLIVFTAVNVLVQSVIQPRFTGDAVGISASVAFVSLVFWTYVLGSLGALLAVPATLFLKAVLLDPWPEGRWVSALISSTPGRTQVGTRRRVRAWAIDPGASDDD